MGDYKEAIIAYTETMLQKIKQLTGALLVTFCFVSLILGVLNIWDVIDNATAKEAFLNTVYTFGAVFVVSLVISLIMKAVSERK